MAPSFIRHIVSKTCFPRKTRQNTPQEMDSPPPYQDPQDPQDSEPPSPRPPQNCVSSGEKARGSEAIAETIAETIAVAPEESQQGSHVAAAESSKAGSGASPNPHPHPQPHGRELPLPPTARYMLGLEDDLPFQRQVCNPPALIDPALFEFEAACVRCFAFQSECECASGKPTSTLPLSELPLTRKPYGTFPTPPGLVTLIGMKATHVAASVANTLWPVISLGIIPIFTQESVALIRSRTIERTNDGTNDAKEILTKMAKPISASKGAACNCGCRESICAQVALRHGLYEDPKALSKAESTTYTIGTDDLTAVTLGNGKTCVRGQFSALVDIDTDFVEDFMLARALLPRSWGNSHLPSNRLAMLSWDELLDSVLVETLARRHECRIGYGYIPLKLTAKHPEGSRLVVRSESFGAGTGCMVLDLGPDDIKGFSEYEVLPPWCSAPNQFLHYIKQAKQGGRSNYRDCTVAPVGEGWGEITFAKNTRVPEFHLAVPGALHLGVPRHPRRGYNCTAKCRKKVSAYCCGFSPPSKDPKETTVYILGNDPVPYLAVSQLSFQYGRLLYFVDHKACLGCTVLKAPRGSIVAGVLPRVLIPK
ncbi:hypothetical protein DL98DRAFT_232149 [Cadophora sp. DSE1049]|nr:hypothetical protein DL98DRAFT_232149 [Cadophora sp. DSE1049]